MCVVFFWLIFLNESLNKWERLYPWDECSCKYKRNLALYSEILHRYDRFSSVRCETTVAELILQRSNGKDCDCVCVLNLYCLMDRMDSGQRWENKNDICHFYRRSVARSFVNLPILVNICSDLSRGHLEIKKIFLGRCACIALYVKYKNKT